MSAYIVEDETINRIVSFLADCADTNKIWLYGPIRSLGYELDKPLHIKRLAEEMFTLNCQSVEGKYGEGEAENMSGGKMFAYQPISPLRFNLYQALKSLGCYLYQACEGECEESPLYQALDAIKGKLAHHLICELPQYEAAKWE
jgi:hypothetical protein